MSALKTGSEKEILTAIDLCNEKGELNRDCIGWARTPLINCNLSGRWLRKKKWNYWYTASEAFLFSATIVNLDFAGMIFVYFLDLNTMKFVEKTLTIPLGKGCKMPDNVGETVAYEGKKMQVHMLAEGASTRLRVRSLDFGGEPLEAELLVSPPEDNETLNVVIPWNDKTFQFTSKQAALPTSGSLRLGDDFYALTPDMAFSGLDFGRGIWPRKVMWNWGTASGMVGDRRIGLNLGAGWTDGTGMTENALYVDGRLTKLGERIIYEYDLKNIMKPWQLTSEGTDNVSLRFTPVYERIAATNVLVVKTDMHQMIGHYSGYIRDESGEKIEIDGLLGCAEEHNTLW